MIAVLDTNGKCIKRFGELPNANNPKSILNKFIARISRSGSIWVGFTALGILRKYSKAGTLEKELNFIDIGSEYAKGLKNENYENEKKGIHGSYLLIEDIAFENEDLLITGGGIVRPIFRYDSEGVLKNSYFIAPKFDSRKRCSYATKNEQGEDIFFILQREEGDTSIGIYGRKK
jgi:hypothetical protein